MSNIVFTGTREVEDVNFILGALYFNGIEVDKIKNVFVGCARGVDKAVRTYFKSIGLLPKVFKADWNSDKKLGGLIRNEEMLIEAKKEFSIFDCEVVGLPCSKSEGTISCLVLAREMGFRTYSYTWEFHQKYLKRWAQEEKRSFTYK